MAVDGPDHPAKEGPPVRKSSFQTKTISSLNTPHTRWTKRSRKIQRARLFRKLISNLFMCSNIQRKCCGISAREFSETIGTCSAVLNHFQSQRPFPSVNRQSSKVVWWGVAVCKVSEAPCIGSPHEDFFFAFLSEFSKRNKTDLRYTQVMRAVPCTTKQSPVLSYFFFLFFSKNHHRQTVASSRAVKHCFAVQQRPFRFSSKLFWRCQIL